MSGARSGGQILPEALAAKQCGKLPLHTKRAATSDGVEAFENFEKARIVAERSEVRDVFGPDFEPGIPHGKCLFDESHCLVGMAESQCGT